MNKSPLNYIVAVAVAAVLWVLNSFIGGAQLADVVNLATLDVDQFQIRYASLMAGGALTGLLGALAWFRKGDNPDTLGNLSGAARTWTLTFFGLLTASAGVVIASIFVFLSEGFAPLDYLIMFVLASLHSWVYYWVITLVCSPVAVKYCVWPRSR